MERLLTPDRFRFERLIDPILNLEQEPRTTTFPSGTTFPEQSQNINPVTPSQFTELPQSDAAPSGLEDTQINRDIPLKSAPAQIARDIYQPQTVETMRLSKLLDEYPRREDPGIVRRILGGVASLSQNPAMVEHALYPGYQRELSDWKERLSPAIQSAALERANNATERQVAAMIGSYENAGLNRERLEARDAQIAADRAEDNRRAQQALDDLNRRHEATLAETKAQHAATNKIAEERLKVYQAIAKGGVFQMDKISGQGRMVYRDGTSTPVDVSQIPQEELIQLQQQNALGRIEAGGEQARQTRQTPSAGTDRYESIDDPNNAGKKLLIKISKDENGNETVTPVQLGGQNVSPTTRGSGRQAVQTGANRRSEEDRKARELKLTRSDLAPFITMKGNTLIDIKRPTAFFNPPTQAQYDEITKYIYGETGAPATQQGAAPAQNIPQGSPLTPPGKVRVRRKSDGATGTMDATDPKLKSGEYEVIK